MANRIRGITVEIGGDTTKLSKALKNVDSSIKSTQTQLRDVNKLLKLDPGNTELLAQKHRLLGDAVGQTKQRLETLKTAAQQAEKALAVGGISKEQYDALQREIVETEQELKKLETAANQSATAVQKIAAKGEKLKTLGDNISNVGQKMLPATIAITGLGTAAVKTASDFDTAMSKVAAISGATGKDFDDLSAKAREMGAKTKFSATEAASAFEYMAMAGWKTEDMLGGIEGIMNLAAASGEDLATTSDIVKEAKACMEVIKGKRFEYPIYFDLEEQSQFAKGKNFCNSVIKSFCGELEKHGYLARLYCSTYYLNNYVSNSVAGKYALWVCQNRSSRR